MTSNLQDDLVPSALFKKGVERWYWILLAACLGGLIGLGLSFLKTPVYEATSTLGIGIDYSRALPLDDDAELYAYSRVRDLLLSDDAILPALTPEANESSDLLVREFRSNIRLDQRGTRWELTVYAQSPEDASRAANDWAENSLMLLTEAQKYALRAIDLQSSFYKISCRLEEGPESTSRAVFVCDVLEPSVDPDDLTEELIREVNMSRGILPALSTSLVARASAGADPITGGRGGLILAGVLIGFLLSFGWLWRR